MLMTIVVVASTSPNSKFLAGNRTGISFLLSLQEFPSWFKRQRDVKLKDIDYQPLVRKLRRSERMLRSITQTRKCALRSTHFADRNTNDTAAAAAVRTFYWNVTACSKQNMFSNFKRCSSFQEELHLVLGNDLLKRLSCCYCWNWKVILKGSAAAASGLA